MLVFMSPAHCRFGFGKATWTVKNPAAAIPNLWSFGRLVTTLDEHHTKSVKWEPRMCYGVIYIVHCSCGAFSVAVQSVGLEGVSAA